MLKPVSIKRINKQDRERKVLFGLVECYIQTGKPIGSNTLKEAGFEDLSSATIRNYFANLEEAGYLTQAHSSGGRIPTSLALRTYAEAFADDYTFEEDEEPLRDLDKANSREIARYLQEGAELLSEWTGCAVFLSAPRFDHDFVITIKLVSLDVFRCLFVLITDFGVVQTEILHLREMPSPDGLKRIENYFHYRLTGIGRPENLEIREEALGKELYHELMLRYIVSYSNFTDEDIYRTGFSRLLAYPDFQETSLLASALSLFENVHSMRLLLKDCATKDRLKFWIGSDLDPYLPDSKSAVIAVPYSINSKPVGAIGLLGPARLPYRRLFSRLRRFSECVSQTLTRTIYKFKISFRQPESGKMYLQKEEYRLIGESRLVLIEDKHTGDI